MKNATKKPATKKPATKCADCGRSREHGVGLRCYTCYSMREGEGGR